MTSQPLTLFGLGCTSLGYFADNYRLWFRRRNARRRNPLPAPRLYYIPNFMPAIRDADVYLIETVSVFLSMRAKLPITASVILADGPLLLSEIPHLKPLDWLGDGWRFKLHPVDYAAFETARGVGMKTTDPYVWSATAPLALDRLGLVIDETASGVLLTPLNAVVFQLNFRDRTQFKALLARYAATLMTLTEFERSTRSLISQGPAGSTQVSMKELGVVFGVLKTHGPLLQQAVAAMIAKKSPNRLIKGTPVSTFELKYLTRLVANAADKVE